ncbi:MULTISPECIES: lipopolysaccharide biosynthesis protein [Streptomyces]|uniref:Lipopolysaccharide biosynthesis protein n=1 Tax=Streptomyces doudnae TaxID=3075536 RepID=A0ABD5ETA1_9ACTN|nr:MULTISPECIES: lipopolysaccharide biosynthesis protein [unclassified Streptomyces]MDT0437569.1 lipopolysaccharide biosynthesis protein [Streptomyces sp. DSM 41981]MYQ67097.1 lipopolysaccharide biosynthesis protein [Streptomyces sp. SID4950]SCE29954.1 Membrane protein involved in the export of O-antigen and teichoic acid [Streptomyces sp. SolWspMP-5a-2]
MSDTTTTTEPAPLPAAEPPRRGRRLRLPGLGGSGGGSPLFRNAYALMLNTGISAVLGLGFWLAAARYYSEDAVGQGSAAIAAMKFLAGLTAVTLTGALARFIPVAGPGTGRLILRTYAGSSLVVAGAAGIFLLSLDRFGPSYRFLHGALAGAGFLVAVVAWNLLTLQDGVLTGLRSAPWVPVGNTVFSAVKLALLVGCAVAVPAAGVFVSWVAAIATSVVPLGWLVFRRLVPRHVEATAGRSQPPGLREIGRFLAGDYTGSLFSLAVVYLVPVLIASQVSSEDNAYFYITTTIGGTVNLLAINMGASLTVEGSHDPARLAADTRAALRRMARIMLPVCGGIFVGAPWILGVFGAGYADAATPLLRWFAVGALLRVVTETHFAVLRAQSRTAGLAWLQGLLCVLVLSLTLLLLPRMGLTGAGVAEISSLAVIVAVAAPRLLRTIRTAPVPAPAEDVSPDGDLADLGAREVPSAKPRRREPAWAVDDDTLALGVHVDFDHQERRPDVRPGPGTPPAGTPVVEPRELHPLPGAGSPRDRVRGPGTETGSAGVELEWEIDEDRFVVPPPPTQDEDRFVVPPPPTQDEDRFVVPPPPAPSATAPQHSPGPPPPSWRERCRPSRAGAVLGGLLAVALLLYWVPAARLGEADLDRMGGLGLISVLPTATLAGAALLVVVFGSLLRLGREHRALLLVTLLATVLSLHALPAVVESEPRFATAWQHLGFLDYIDRTGSAVPDLDARWSWPGFFAVAAFVARACGVTDLTEVIRWWPTLIELLYLAPLFLLTRALRASWRARWTGIWVFALSSWVGQDYFSPQGFTYLLYLAFVALLLVWFRAPRVVWTRTRPGEREVEPAERRQKAVLLAVVIGLFAASVPAHQLTPFVMLGVLTVLVLLRRSELVGLPLLFAVLVIGWLGFMAEPYWSGHFDDLFGGVGGVGGNVSSSVSGRIEGGSPAHKLVLYARVALAGGVLALACWGWLRRRRLRYREVALPVLTFVPFLGFGMQSYGGEMALRVFMFALPGAALLCGLALFPRTGATAGERERDRPGLASGVALLTGLLLMGGFLVARWGNEAFERTRPGEVAAMEYVYAHDDPTVRLLWLSDDPVNNVTPAMPWGARDMERVDYVPTLAPSDPALVSGLVKALRDAGPQSYLMVGGSQVTYLEMDVGYPATWESRLLRNLDRRPELEKVMGNKDAAVYALRERPGSAVPRADPGPIGPRITWTPWSIVGGLAAVALLVLLTARELVRVAVRPGVRQLHFLQGSFWFSLPLLAVFLASLVQRFLTMK